MRHQLRPHIGILIQPRSFNGRIATEISRVLMLMLITSHVCDRLGARSLQLTCLLNVHIRRAHGSCWSGYVLLRLLGSRPPRMDLNIRWRLGKFALRLDEAGLKTDDIIAQLVVFRLDSIVPFIEDVVVLYLCFKVLDVVLFPLSKRTLL